MEEIILLLEGLKHPFNPKFHLCKYVFDWKQQIYKFNKNINYYTSDDRYLYNIYNIVKTKIQNTFKVFEYFYSNTLKCSSRPLNNKQFL